MNHIHTPRCNFMFTGPKDQKPEALVHIDDLHVQRTTAPDGGPLIRSFWKPSPEELALLNAGCPVSLDIYHFRMPPVSVHVQEKL